ncbi:MAG: hypothetical protein ACOCV1_01610 [Bacillota bacterium]
MKENEKAIKRREYVNKKFGEMTRGKSLSPRQKTKIFKRLWKVAKRKYK